MALVFELGYRLLAAGLGCAAWVNLAGLRGNASRGATLRWCAGQWSFGRAGLMVPVTLLPRTRALPWGVYLAWRESISGRRGSCWLFADSVPPPALRRLRCRLALRG